MVTSDTFTFGSFRLMPTERTLLDDGKPLRLGNRALDILVMLIEHAGETVSKDELIARAWPDTVVDEASLRVHIAALRKVLGEGHSGDRFITNIPGRGYVFVAPAVREIADAPASEATAASQGADVPAPLTHIIGRDAVVAMLSGQLARHRLLTVVGPGGIGKTTTAVAVANAVRANFAHGVWFIELAPLPDPNLLPSALSGVFGIPLPPANPVGGLTAWLRDKHALIVLDNCEHLIAAVAPLVEEIMRSATGISVLATSREPLRAQGEWRHRLAPLEFPHEEVQLTQPDALAYSAVQLFSDRASAASDDFSIADDDIPAVLEICRRLDGVPLALELAAAHVGAFGIKGLAARLHDRLPLLIQGRRTALPRQQTLRATLDWSYDLLSEAEQVILRRLAVFRGDFTLAAASAVAADATLSPVSVVNGVANLVDKSLVVADIGGEITYYRLLGMTRAYAEQRLQESAEVERVARLHARYFRELFVRAEANAATRSQAEWLAGYGRDIGNLRTALQWALSPGGDAALGVALAAAATDFWLALSLLGECSDWASKAIALLGGAVGTQDEMRLQCGLGQALTRTRGAPPEADVAFRRALALAEHLADVGYQFRAIFGLWMFSLRVVDFAACLTQVQRLEALAAASGEPSGSAVADWAYSETLYYTGEHAAAADRLAGVQASYPMAMRGGDLVRYGNDLPISVLAYQAVVFWCLGFADQALRASQKAVEEARRINFPVPLCVALTAPRSTLLTKMGYLEEAERDINLLIECAQVNSLTPYHSYGLCSKGSVVSLRGDHVEAERLLRLGLQRARAVGQILFDAFFLGELAIVLGAAGRTDDALVEIDAALRQGEAGKSHWCMPELLRIKGELLGAEEWFIRSLDLARRQGALAWELRAATSLTRLWHGHRRTVEARALLAEVYGKFTEGFATADMRAAQELLRLLS